MRGIIRDVRRKMGKTNWLVAGSDGSTGFAWNRQNDDLLGIKTFIMLECRGGRVTGVLNNAIWRRGVAALCRLCRIPPPYTPTPATPLHPPWLPPSTNNQEKGRGGDRDGGTVQSNADWKILMGLSIRGSSLRPPLFPSLLPEIPEIIFSYNRTFDGRPIFISEEKLILIDHLIRWSISFVIGWRKLLIMNVRSVAN